MGTPPIRARGAAALGLALVAIAALFGLPSLLPLAAALIVLPLIAIAWVAGATRGLRLHRSVPAGPLLEGEPGKLRLELERGRLPLPGGELIDPLRPAPIGFGLRPPPVDEDLTFPRRGRQPLGRGAAVVRDPLGLAERRVESADGGELIVLPRPQQLRYRAGGAGARSLGAGARGGGGSGPDSWAAEFEIDGLRPYRDGTPASRIHWPTVARTGELQERRITAGADAARLIVIDPTGAADPAALDAAIRAAASLCVELARIGCAVMLPPRSRLVELESSLRGWPELHSRLALLEPDAGAPAVHRIGRAGLAILLSADPSRRPEQELRRIPAARRILVRPGLAEGPAALFSVAGCVGRAVGAARRSRTGVVAR